MLSIETRKPLRRTQRRSSSKTSCLRTVSSQQCQASVGPVLLKVLVLFHKWMHLGILTGALSYLMAKPSLAQKEGIALGQLSNEGSPAPGKMCHAEYHLFI